MRSEHSHRSTSIESKLAERLTAEAFVERPAFSDTLHARMMQAIAVPQSPATFKRGDKSGWSATRWIAIAAGLLFAALGVMQLGGSNDARLQGNPPGPTTNRVAVVEAAGNRLSLDDLDHGAAIAVQLVVDQLPIEVPAVDWGAALVD
jgi:hypothetical protein